MPIAIEVADPATEADHEAVMQKLIAFNDLHASSEYEPYALRLRDDASGEVVGGLFGRKYYGWLFVELLFVPEQGRRQGLGSRMLAEAEAFARSKGCIGVWLDTFSFQAPDFYPRSVGNRRPPRDRPPLRTRWGLFLRRARTRQLKTPKPESAGSPPREERCPRAGGGFPCDHGRPLRVLASEQTHYSTIRRWALGGSLRESACDKSANG
jgi:GNAT superfamily N-acetyltransferase